MNAIYDAIVIGGGPAGATTAMLLAKAGWSVALAERKMFPRRKVCGEYLSASNLPLFDQLGIGERFRDLAGPPVTKVGVYAGATVTQADLPNSAQGLSACGRALSRAQLDTWLLDEGRAAGVEIRQPWAVDELAEERGMYQCHVREVESGITGTMVAPIVVAAHGSWEPGPLLTQPPRSALLPADLLAFKAHFLDSNLPEGLMPLLVFRGGYGGMVHCDGGQISLSCCVRRDQLARIREKYPGEAGEAVLTHVRESCLGVRRALRAARRQGSWLAAGPIRPGIRLHCRGGIFPVGNVAGEAHPVIAEGISMAMQSAWLLCTHLIAWRRQGGARDGLMHVALHYAAAWRRAFAPRLHTGQVVAQWAMSPLVVAGTLPLLRCLPATLTWFARLSGKATLVRQ